MTTSSEDEPAFSFLGVLDITSARSVPELGILTREADGHILGIPTRRLTVESHGDVIFNHKMTYNDLVFLMSVLARGLADDLSTVQAPSNIRLGGGEAFKETLQTTFSEIAAHVQHAQEMLSQIDFANRSGVDSSEEEAI